MNGEFEAIFANGVFTPIRPLKGLAENQRVKIQIFVGRESHVLDDLIGTMPAGDAAELMQIIDEEFGSKESEI